MGTKKSYPNSGSISKNEQKQEPNHADISGNGELDCPCCNATLEFYVNGWKKTAQETGKTFYSLSFRKARRKGEQAGQSQPQQQTMNTDEDDLGF